MAPSEHTESNEAPPPVPARRIAVYCAAVLALGVVAWALIEGGERDLWNQTSMITPAFELVILSL